MNRSPKQPTGMQETTEAIWTRYLATRAPADRDELVGYYLPWAQDKAVRIARRLKIADVENAAAEDKEPKLCDLCDSVF